MAFFWSGYIYIKKLISVVLFINPYLNDGRKFEPSLKSHQKAPIEGLNFDPSFRFTERDLVLTVSFLE